MNQFDTAVSRTGGHSIEINKCLKNTYMLLGLALLFSGTVAWMTKDLQLPFMRGGMGLIIFLGGFFAINAFINAFRNFALGILGVFMLTGFLGMMIAPSIGMFVANGASNVVFAAAGTTGIIFLALSAYVLVTRKNFAFLGGMLAVGILTAFVLMLLNVFFLQLPAMHLAISAVFVLLMSGLILHQTSSIVHGGETNYIMATTTLFVAIFNLFTSLLSIFGFMSDD